MTTRSAPHRLIASAMQIALSVTLLSIAPAFADVQRYVAIAKEEQLLFADDPAQWSKPRAVVPPTYPGALLEKGTTGYVDVALKLTKYGQVEQVATIRSVPPAPEMEDAVRQVISMWLFHEPISDTCAPQESAVNTRIWFEIKEGKPSISVSSNPGTSHDASSIRSPRVSNLTAVAQRLMVNYPRGARRDGFDAKTYSVMTVNGDTGKTTAVDVVEVLTNQDYVRAFTNATITGLMSAEFATGDEHKGRVFKVCKSVSFKLS